MAILNFQKPDKVIMLEGDNAHGKFEFRPLEPGYGVTVGNALRRVLLSSLEGFAINSIKVDGVEHEFTSIPGVIGDVTEIILNLKQIRFKQLVEDSPSETINVSLSGKEEFKAGELNKYLSSFTVLNPDHLICKLEPNVDLNIELNIKKGRGYVPAEENRTEDQEYGVIAVDSIYTPIRNVKYSIENYRIEQKTDYEKLLLEVTTDGSIHPKDAIKEAAKILIYHFMLFSNDEISVESEQKPEHEEFDEDALHMRQLLKTRLEDMNLSVRALNCLKSAEVETLGDLVKYDKNELLKFRNFGKKSLTEIEDLVNSKGLSFGMDISKYKLEEK